MDACMGDWDSSTEAHSVLFYELAVGDSLGPQAQVALHRNMMILGLKTVL